MKKSVLLFVSTMLTAVCAVAQPAKPTVAYSDWVEETDVYLYNVEAGMFLTAGNDWGTRACLLGGGNTNNIITVERFKLGEGTLKGVKWSIIAEEGLYEGKTCYRIANLDRTSGSLSADDPTGIWVDGDGNRPVTGWFKAKENGDKTFELGYAKKTTEGEGDNVEVKYTPMEGVLAANAFNSGNINVNFSNDGVCATWALVSVDEYDRVQPLLARYYAYEALDNTIKTHKSFGIDVDYSAYEAVLNNNESTTEEYLAECGKLRPTISLGAKIKEAKESDAKHDWSAYETVFGNAASTAEEISNAVAMIDASMALKKAIDEAKDKSLDVAESEAVYAKADATLDELKAAKETVQAAIDTSVVGELVKGATADNPVSLTSYIVNPTFDTIGDFHGWSNGFGVGGHQWSSAEVYGKSFDVYQDIKNMPTGVYMVACNGYTRYRSAQEDYAAWLKGEVSETKIYLKSTTYGQYFTPVKHIAEGGVETPFNVDSESTVKTEDGGEIYFPNTMYAADFYFNDPENPTRYRNEAYGPLKQGDVLRIGLFNNKASNSDWSIFDDFELLYLGDGLDAYQKWGASVKKSIAGVDFEDEKYYGKPEKDAYEKVLDEMENASSKEAIAAAILNIDSIAGDVTLSKKNYADYVQVLKDAQSFLDGGVEGDMVAKLTDYLEAEDAESVAEWEFPNGPLQAIIPDYPDSYEGLLSNADIVKETEYLSTLLSDAKKDNLVDGSDVTGLIVNPGFEEAGGKGWKLDTSKGGTGSLTNWHGGDATNYCAEAYQQNFDVYQEIEGLKDGLYEVSVQAFYRTTWPLEAYNAYLADPEMKGDAKVYPEVYIGEFGTPIRNVMELSFPETIANADNFSVFDDGAKRVPNGMSSASSAFSLEDPEQNYTMSAYGLVQGGKLRIGIRKLDAPVPNGSWTLWDNFKLTYRAKNADVLNKVLDDKIAAMGTLIDENAEKMTSPVAKDANAIYEKSQKTSGMSTDVKYNVLIDLNASYVAAQRNVYLVEEYASDNEAYANACESMEDYYEAIADTTKQKVNAMDAEIVGDAYMNLDNEKLDDLLTRMKSLTNEVSAAVDRAKKLAAAEELKNSASDEDPIDCTLDYITNPDMEDGGDNTMPGWTFKLAKGNGPVKGSGGINGRSLEAWSGTTGAELDFSAYQTLTYLPEGTYTLTAKAANASNGVTSDETAWNNGTASEGRVYLCVFTSNMTASVPVEPNIGAATEANEYSVTFTVKGEEDVKIGFQTIGVVPFRWFMCDDFKLVYYGASSNKEVTPDEGQVDIDEVEAAAANVVVAVYNASGIRVDAPQKGLNIVKYANGNVKKVYVK